MAHSDSIRNETTLATIAQNPEANEQSMLFAIIIDISEPRQEGDSSFITRLKLIDPSFNYKVQQNNPRLRFHKFVHVSIFSDSLEGAPRIKFVGDIVRLRRFRFKLSDRNELKAYEKPYSNWLIYSGRKNEPFTVQCCKVFEKNVGREMSSYEEGRVTDLRFWADHFFFMHSLRYIAWWVDLPKDDTLGNNGRGKTTSKNIDLILRVQKNDVKRQRLRFGDANGRLFELAIESSALNPGDVIQLKCVDVVTESSDLSIPRLISLTPNSSCLHLPKYFLDHRILDRSTPQSSNAASQKGPELPAFLADFIIEPASRGKRSTKKDSETSFVSAVRINSKGMKVTPIAELLRVLETEAQSLVSQKFLVEGSITGFLSLEPLEIVKRFYPQTREIEPITNPPKDGCHRPIYHLVPLIRDESLAADQHLQAYILTNEHEPYIFDAWGVLPAYEDMEAWSALKEGRLQEFVKKLNALKKPEFRVRLIVQLMMTPSKKFFYRVFDTVFLAFNA